MAVPTLRSFSRYVERAVPREEYVFVGKECLKNVYEASLVYSQGEAFFSQKGYPNAENMAKRAFKDLIEMSAIEVVPRSLK